MALPVGRDGSGGLKEGREGSEGPPGGCGRSWEALPKGRDGLGSPRLGLGGVVRAGRGRQFRRLFQLGRAGLGLPGGPGG